MLIHCSKKLAAKLPDVSAAPLEETGPLGSWHGHLFHMDRRQCLMLCHDASRGILFLPGVRKEDLLRLDRWFVALFTGTLGALGAADNQVKRASLVLGPVRYDSVTDRSVQSSITIARRDLQAMAYRVPNVKDLDPIAVSAQLCQRPATVHGKWIWPDRVLLETVRSLADDS